MQALPSQLKEVDWPHDKLCKEVRDQGTDNANVHNTGVQACHMHPLDCQRLACNICQGYLREWAFGGT